jgi:hypothetical protein
MRRPGGVTLFSPTKPVIARFMQATQFVFDERKRGHPDSRVMTNFLEI